MEHTPISEQDQAHSMWIIDDGMSPSVSISVDIFTQILPFLNSATFMFRPLS